MRASCNGCRVLRKGCSEDCCIRPCLHWISSSSHSQGNATLFLAKFYGRAGLVNLINSGPNHLRPRIFKSLLYEACGRIIDPIEGAVGLMTSGKWNLCDEAVEAVLLTATPITTSTLSHPDAKPCDIRHLPCKSKVDDAAVLVTTSHSEHKVCISKRRKRSKRSSDPPTKHKKRRKTGAGKWSTHCYCNKDESSVSTEVGRAVAGDISSSVETAKLADDDVELELTLGLRLIGWY